MISLAYLLVDSTTDANTLPDGDFWPLLGVMVVTILLTGALLLARRWSRLGGDDADKPTVVRAWLAISLVAGTLILAAASMFIDDTTMRSLLMGGLVASAGTSVAFYFASRDAEKTQENLLAAAMSEVPGRVPDVEGLVVSEARITLALRGYRPVTAASIQPTDTVKHSSPGPNSALAKGQQVTLTV